MWTHVFSIGDVRWHAEIYPREFGGLSHVDLRRNGNLVCVLVPKPSGEMEAGATVHPVPEDELHQAISTVASMCAEER